MSSKKGDVKFKYVNAIPSRVSAGTFYWKYENNVNQLYFSPTENGEDILRLDLSQDLAEKIANFNMELNGSLTINVEEGDSEGVYTLSVIIKEQNPLSVITNEQGKKGVVISENNVEDPTGTQTLMSAAQIKEIINQIVDRDIIWENKIDK